MYIYKKKYTGKKDVYIYNTSNYYTGDQCIL